MGLLRFTIKMNSACTNKCVYTTNKRSDIVQSQFGNEAHTVVNVGLVAQPIEGPLKFLATVLDPHRQGLS